MLDARGKLSVHQQEVLMLSLEFVSVSNMENNWFRSWYEKGQLWGNVQIVTGAPIASYNEAF